MTPQLSAEIVARADTNKIVIGTVKHRIRLKKEWERTRSIKDHPDAKAILEFYQGDATLQPGIPAPREHR